jgi:hypothetical protein
MSRKEASKVRKIERKINEIWTNLLKTLKLIMDQCQRRRKMRRDLH